MTHTPYTTRDRTFDYLQLRWLEKTTGRPACEWDYYIIKELLDNALDADERWGCKHGGAPTLAVDLHYRRVPALDINSLEIAVSNCAPFPTEELSAFFDLSAYTSSKSHYNYPTRGHQGNALKTILGIPYALRHYHYGDYANLHKPLVIETGEQSWLVTFDIDERQQQVQVRTPSPELLNPPHPGTRIRVGIDRFAQPEPRTLEELLAWAQRFALLNPHATFTWRVKMGKEQIAWEFPADPAWNNLFRNTAPILWYEYSQVRDLLLALERSYGEAYPLAQVLQEFAGFTLADDPAGTHASDLCTRLGFQTLGELKLTSDHHRTLRNSLWPALQHEGRSVAADDLGGLGEAQVVPTLTAMFELEAPPLYRRIVHDDPEDRAHPFVLELAVARLPNGRQRHIWTGLNHTPTYEDPFYTQTFVLSERAEAHVLGLDGILDRYGQTSDTPVLLLLHIICPNLAFQDFSKTKIDPRPFRDVLVASLHELLTAFTKTEEVENLQQTVHALLPLALEKLSPTGERFALAQLLRLVRRLLVEQLQQDGQADLAEHWLADPSADMRLQGYIQAFPGALEHVIQAEREHFLILPVHPDDHTMLPLRRLDQRVLDEACVNKLLLMADPDLEALFIANGLLTRFDAALLHSEGSFDQSFDALLPHMERLRCPLVLLHHATPSGCLLVERLQARLTEAGQTHLVLHDMGLTPAQGQALGLPPEPTTGPSNENATALARVLSPDEVAFLVDERQQMSLFSLTVAGIVAWIEQQCETIGLPPKCIPDDDLCAAILSARREQVLQHLITERSLAYEADWLIQQQQEDGELRMEEMVQQVREALRAESRRAWRAVVGELEAMDRIYNEHE